MNYEIFPDKVFVFGSNESGIHGSGAARFALANHGAIYGQAWGRQGNSFAIPTKDSSYQYALSLGRIESYVLLFIEYAKAHPNETFQVTRIGCGLAGYTDSDIAPMFKDAPDNCELPKGWREFRMERR